MGLSMRVNAKSKGDFVLKRIYSCPTILKIHNVDVSAKIIPHPPPHSKWCPFVFYPQSLAPSPGPHHHCIYMYCAAISYVIRDVLSFYRRRVGGVWGGAPIPLVFK